MAFKKPEPKKKSKFRICPKCKTETMLFTCTCGHVIDQKKAKEVVPTQSQESE